ncbi:F-box/kelch-repeat protein [Spatholobus suberectus]|nr:F-box/kelch-repeat protein [Spatholobus suberectus]
MIRVEGTKREMVSIEQYLPRELVSNILSRLPAKDLLKCKRVCKSWDLWLKETDERKLGYWTAELYSLNSNSWRKPDAALPLPIEIWGSSPVYTYVNNCCHWWCFVDESGRKDDVVLAFDMVSESFRKIKVPRIRYSSEEEFATLFPFDESATIGVIVYPVRGKEKSFDVWVMKDYWDEGSWVKQYTVEPIEEIYKLVGFYGSNQYLWSSFNDGLVWYDYDPESEQIKDLQNYRRVEELTAVNKAVDEEKDGLGDPTMNGRPKRLSKTLAGWVEFIH